MSILLCAVDATWSSINAFSVTNPNLILVDDTKGYQKVTEGTLTSLTIYASKTRNPSKPVYGSGAKYAARDITSTNDVYLYFNINGINIPTNKQRLDTIVNFRSSGYNAYAIADKSYTFNNLNIPLNKDTKVNIRFTGLVSSVPATVATIWHKATNYNGVRYRIVGSAIVSTGPENPTSINVSPNSIKITDLSGTIPSSVNGVKKGPNASVTITATGGEITNLSMVSSPNKLTSSYNIINKTKATVNVKANGNNINYPTTITTTVTANGGKSTRFTTSFYEKIDHTTELKSNSNLVANILQLQKPLYYELKSFNEYKTTAAQGKKIFNRTLNKNKNFSVINNNLIPETYFSLDRDCDLFPISNQNIPQQLIWRFYNSEVQEATSEQGTYKKDINTNITYTMTPNLQDQFSYEWSVDESIVPDIVLYKQGAPTVKTLKYTNKSGYGGYCRGFKISLLDTVTGEEIKQEIKRVSTVTEDDETILNEDIFSYFNDVKTGFYNVKITTFFYFNNDINTLYEGVSKTLTQKLLFISNEEILPGLVFPKLADNSPYTHMMLTATERYGYEFNSIIYENKELLKATFGLRIGNKEITMKDSPTYFSSNTITKHLVFNIGKFISDNYEESFLINNLQVKPFLELNLGNENIKISVDSNPKNKKINSYTDTTAVTTDKKYFWLRPSVKSGEELSYFDYDRCEKYIDKYEFLSSFEEIESFKLKLGTVLAQLQILSKHSDFSKMLQGEIVNTVFWDAVAAVLADYAENMQNWATDATNFLDLWALPQFKHKKGEIITDDNLYQNYWDLLNQFNFNFTIHGEEQGSEFPAVRLINPNGEPIKYTHDELYSGNKGYTHNEITNQFRKRGNN